MDSFINAINNLITNLSTEFIPISNVALRVSIGTLIISLLNILFKSNLFESAIKPYLPYGKMNRIQLRSSDPYYDYLTEYLITKFKKELCTDYSQTEIILSQPVSLKDRWDDQSITINLIKAETSIIYEIASQGELRDYLSNIANTYQFETLILNCDDPKYITFCNYLLQKYSTTLKYDLKRELIKCVGQQAHNNYYGSVSAVPAPNFVVPTREVVHFPNMSDRLDIDGLPVKIIIKSVKIDNLVRFQFQTTLNSTLVLPQYLDQCQSETQTIAKPPTLFKLDKENSLYDSYCSYFLEQFKSQISVYTTTYDENRLLFNLVPGANANVFVDTFNFKGYNHQIVITVSASQVQHSRNYERSQFEDIDDRASKSMISKSSSSNYEFNFGVSHVSTQKPKSNLKSKSKPITTIDIATEYLSHCTKEKEQPDALICYVVNPCASSWSASWLRKVYHTNFNLKNMSFTPEFQKDCLDDFDNFYQSKSWYRSRGLPYQRGYILGGIPGSGKTSTVRGLSLKYHIPIFVVSSQLLSSKTLIMSQLDKIASYARNNYHIVLFEDFDRSPLFTTVTPVTPIVTTSTSTTSTVPSNQLTEADKSEMIRYLINWMDGIVENDGRIIFFTANDPEVLKNHSALVRPNRIDKIIYLSYATPQQIEDLFFNFYQLKTKIDLNLENSLTITEIINLFKQNADNPDQVLKILAGHSEGIDYPNTTYQLILKAKREQANIANNAPIIIQ